MARPKRQKVRKTARKTIETSIYRDPKPAWRLDARRKMIETVSHHNVRDIAGFRKCRRLYVFPIFVPADSLSPSPAQNSTNSYPFTADASSTANGVITLSTTAMGFATFSIFRHSSDRPIFTIVKYAKGSHRGGDFVVSSDRSPLKRGNFLGEALSIFDNSLKLVSP